MFVELEFALKGVHKGEATKTYKRYFNTNLIKDCDSSKDIEGFKSTFWDIDGIRYYSKLTIKTLVKKLNNENGGNK